MLSYSVEILWNQIKPQMKHQVPTCWALENPVCRGVPLQVLPCFLKNTATLENMMQTFILDKL